MIRDYSARRALISSGLVALTTQLLVKVANVDFESALPAGIATALTVDYFTNQIEDSASVSSFKDSLYEYFTKFKTPGGKLRDRRGWEYQQLLTAFVVLLGIVGGISYVSNQYTTIPPPPVFALPLGEFGIPSAVLTPLRNFPLRDAGLSPVIVALRQRVMRAIRLQMTSQPSHQRYWNQELELQMRHAVDAGIENALLDIDHDVLRINYHRGGVAIIDDGGERSAVFWNDKIQRSEAVPLLELNQEDVERVILDELEGPEPDEIPLTFGETVESLLFANSVTPEQAREIMGFSPGSLARNGRLTINGVRWTALWYIVGIEDQLESIEYLDSNGNTATYALPLLGDALVEEYEMQLIDRPYTPGEVLKIEGWDEIRFLVLTSSADKKYYLVRELLRRKDGSYTKAGRILIIPGDRFEGRPGRGVTLPFYESPTIEDFGYDDVSILDAFEDLQEQFEMYGGWKGKRAISVEWSQDTGHYKFTFPDDSYILMTDLKRDTAKPIKIGRLLSDVDEAKQIGVRTYSMTGGKIASVHEVVFVLHSFGFVIESLFNKSKESWTAERYYLIPLVETEDDDESESVEMDPMGESQI